MHLPSRQLLFRLLAAVLCLAMIGAACGGASTEEVSAEPQTDTTPADPAGSAPDTSGADEPNLETDAEQPAPQDLAMVDDPSDQNASEETTSEDTAGEDTTSEDTTGEASESDDAAMDAPVEERSPAEIFLNRGNRDLGVLTLNGSVLDADTDKCVADKLDESDELRRVWDIILEDENANALTNDERSEAIDPILDCVSFGQLISVVIADGSGLELSDDSVACIDDALSGNEALLIDLLTEGPEVDTDKSLVNAMVNCVSIDELNSLMAS